MAQVTALSPSVRRDDTVMDRYSRRGILPTLEDFQRFPRRSLDVYDEIVREVPSNDQLYRAMVDDSAPVVFLLEASVGYVATIRLARTTLRIGEEINCSVFLDRESSRQGDGDSIKLFQLLSEITCTQSIVDPETGDILFRHRQLVMRHEEACWLHRVVSFSLSLPSDLFTCPLSLCLEDLGALEWAFEVILLCAPHTHDSPQLSVTPVESDKNVVQCRIPLTIVPSLAALKL